jgi:hypothetical protein
VARCARGSLRSLTSSINLADCPPPPPTQSPDSSAASKKRLTDENWARFTDDNKKGEGNTMNRG